MNALNRKSHVDWYSFTFEVGAVSELTSSYAQIVQTKFIELLGDVTIDLILTACGDFAPHKGRRPYGASYKATGIQLFFGVNQEYALCEISGHGCKELAQIGVLEAIIAATHQRATRVDVATDIYVGFENKVIQFASAGFSPKFKSHGQIKSSKGTTYYVGSRKSGRFTRVYQYEYPHPRAEWLRIECELKKEYARLIAKALSNGDSADVVAAYLGNVYEWQSELWIKSTINLSIPTTINRQRDNDTLHWLVTQVKPALARLKEDGIIDNIEEWIVKNLV